MTDKGTVTAHASHRIMAPPERVYDAWLDPEKARIWMRMALTDFGLPGDVRRMEIDPRVGGRFTFSDMRQGGEAVHWGSYLLLDRPHRLVFTWFTSQEEEKTGISTVTLVIEPEGTGCVATMTHEMDAKWADYVEQTERGWSTMLTQIDIMLESAAEGEATDGRNGDAD